MIMKTLGVLILFAGLCAVSAYGDDEYEEMFMDFNDGGDEVSKSREIMYSLENIYFLHLISLIFRMHTVKGRV